MSPETRMTNQRMKILEYLKGVTSHPTAEQVYNEVVKDLPAITLATVYRNLNFLAENGEVLRLEINKEYHFDADISKHQHCVCKSCWKVSDVFQPEISEMALKNVNCQGFNPVGVNVIFYGTCDKCKNGGC